MKIHNEISDKIDSEEKFVNFIVGFVPKIFEDEELKKNFDLVPEMLTSAFHGLLRNVLGINNKFMSNPMDTIDGKDFEAVTHKASRDGGEIEQVAKDLVEYTKSLYEEHGDDFHPYNITVKRVVHVPGHDDYWKLGKEERDKLIEEKGVVRDILMIRTSRPAHSIEEHISHLIKPE